MTIDYKCPRCLTPLAASQPAVCQNCGAQFPQPESAEIIDKPEKAPDPDRPAWGPWISLGMWLFSIVVMYGAAVPAMLGWLAWRAAHGVKPTLKSGMEQNPDLVVFFLLATLLAQLITLLAARFLVVKLSDTNFLTALGWHWHPRFRLIHTIGLTIVIFVMVAIVSQLLPNSKTDLQRILDSSIYARIITATLAVCTAPIVEEVIYRGILYSGLRKKFGVWPAVLGVSLLFVGVHVPQYWGGWGVIASLGLLSLILTLVRAFTGSLLPCFMIHLFFNGVQAIGIVIQGFIDK